MTRLLFAAARGARIEFFSSRELEWVVSNSAPTAVSQTTVNFRIHPDDEHLQYGPISSALREAAERTSPVLAHTMADFTSTGAVCDYTSVHERSQGWILAGEIGDEGSPEFHRSLFLLILAEALADEGV